MFYFNFIICIILYLVMFIAAPFIGEFYGDKTLIPLIRHLMLIISGVKGIQQAYV